MDCKGILTVADISSLNGHILSRENLCNSFGIEVNFLQYLSFKSAIPKQWCNLIKNVSKPGFECNLEKGPIILVKSIPKHLVKLKCKDFYHLFIEKIFSKPTSKDAWATKSALVLDDATWKFIYNLPYTLTIDTQLQTFHFKIVHRIFACNYKLHIRKKCEDNLCKHCNDRCTDDLFHYFIDCSKSANFWKSVFSFWKSTFSVGILLDKVEILFGTLNVNEDKILHCLNFVLLTGKYLFSFASYKTPTLYLVLIVRHLPLF